MHAPSHPPITTNQSLSAFDDSFLGFEGAEGSSWGLCGNGLKYPNSNNHDTYPVHFSAGDVVRVTVDMDKKQVSYAVNGVSGGVAFAKVDEEELAVAVSMYNPGEQVTVLSKAQAALYEMQFDSNKKGDKVKLSNEGRTATATVDNQTVAVNTWLSKGVHSVVFRVEHGKDVTIGLMNRNFKHFNHGHIGVGDLARTSMGISPRGRQPADKGEEDYAKFETGDVVRMIIDMDKRVLSYVINGVNYGPCFENIDTEVCPAVSLHREGCSVSLLVGSQTYRSPFIFDTGRKGKDIVLSDANRTAIAQAENQTVATTSWLTKGIHSALIRINKDSGYLCIGILSRGYNGFSAGYIGYGDFAKDSMGCASGTKYPNPANESWKTVWKAGDVVRVTVDMNHRTVSYAVNGHNNSKAFTRIDDEVCIGVSLHSAGDSVTLLCP